MKKLFLMLIVLKAVLLSGVYYKTADIPISLQTGRSDCMDINNGMLFVASNEEGFFIYDLNLIDNPVLLYENEYLMENLQCVTAYGGKAFVGYDGNVDVYDVADPDDISFIATINSQISEPAEIFFDGNIMYVCGQTLKIIDVSDVNNVSILATFQEYNANYGYEHGAVNDDYLYLTGFNLPIRVINVSDPSNPTLDHDIPKPSMDCSYLDLEVHDNLMFVSRYFAGFRVYDISNAQTPIEIGDHICNHFVGRIEIDYPYLITDGIKVFDISDPDNIHQLSFYNQYENPIETWTTECFTSEDYRLAFSTRKKNGIQIVNMGNPTFDEIETVFTKEGVQNLSFFGISLNNNYLCVSNLYNEGLDYLDITDINNIQYTTMNDTNDEDYALDVILTDSYSYLCILNECDEIVSAIYEYDNSNFLSPFMINSFGGWQVLRDPYRIRMFGDKLGVCDTSFGIKLFDVSDPYNPTECLHIEDDYDNSDLDVEENLLYTTNKMSGFRIYDISNTSQPQLLSHVQTNEALYGLLVQDDYAYVSAENEIIVFDVTDPYNPQQVCNFQAHDSSYFRIPPVLYQDNLLVFDVNWNEFQLLDITDPENTEMIAHKKWNRSISDIEIYGDIIITSNNREGVSFWNPEWNYVGTNKIMSIQDNFHLQNFPNPFNPSTTISFSLATEITEDTKISIYNLKGQKVKTFSNHQITQSPNQQIVWDGTDQNNKPVSSGVYLYKLETKENQISRKMLLLK